MSGMLWIWNCCAIAGSSSMLILTTLYAPSRMAAICSTIGDTCRHGPHHGAQKSTITGTSLRRTSFSNVAVRSEEHTSELQSHRDLHSFPTRRSSDLLDDRRHLPARPAPRRPEVDDHGDVAAEDLVLERRG